ncbi:MAG: 4'-phosphopantetheinyl transferase superfamily protein [Gammaproteobacteria bacterium]|nr:4'-phosphopantetheinyl transferase superfamily protein [Gammaproteobacteria bacterium]
MRYINTLKPTIWLLGTDFLSANPKHAHHTLTLLSHHEKIQHAAFKFPKDKELYLTAHYLKRQALSIIYPTVTPKKWTFRINQYGKPFIKNPTHRNIQFNLSHSQKLTGIIICEKHTCGFDIEYTHKDINWLSLAQGYFHPKEYEQVKRHDKNMFFKIWTLKEAFIKFTGKGLSFPLNEFCIDTEKTPMELNFSTQDIDSNHRTVKLWHQELEGGYHIAGAAHNDSRLLWPPEIHWLPDYL